MQTSFSSSIAMRSTTPRIPRTKGTAEIIIGKQRNGPIGKVRLSFIGNLTKFENLAPRSIYEDFVSERF